MVNRLDAEWVALIKQAKELGLTQEEIKNFLSVANKGEAPVTK